MNLARCFVMLLCVGLVLSCQAQKKGISSEEKGIPTRILQPSSTRALAVPQFGFLGIPRSDKDGDLFFMVGSGTDLRRASVLKILSQNGEASVYAFPQDAGGFITFGVSPSGDVAVISENDKGELQVISFDSKGTASRKTRLLLPSPVQVVDFLVFDDGNMFIAGYFREALKGSPAGKTYTAIVDPNGKPLRLLNVGNDVDVKGVSSHMFDGAASIGFDGNVYIARDNRVSTFTEGGRLVSKRRFQKPNPEFSVVNLVRSPHYFALWMTRTAPDGGNELRLLVIDATTSAPLALYEPQSQLGTSAVAFTDSGFTFINGNGTLAQLQFTPIN